jgi:hypothetical protein
MSPTRLTCDQQAAQWPEAFRGKQAIYQSRVCLSIGLAFMQLTAEYAAGPALYYGAPIRYALPGAASRRANPVCTVPAPYCVTPALCWTSGSN